MKQFSSNFLYFVITENLTVKLWINQARSLFNPFTPGDPPGGS